MASKRQLLNGTWQYTIKKAGLLPKPIYQTFNSEAEGDAYVERLMKLLDRGIVPTQHEVVTKVITLSDLMREYERAKQPSENDRMAFNVIDKRWGRTGLGDVTVDWVDAWIKEQKRIEQLTPRTIRGRVSALARAVKWGNKFGVCKVPDAAFELEHGYSQYGDEDKAQSEGGRVDVERERRLEEGEYEKILNVIDTGFLPRKQGTFVIEHKEAVKCLFVLAVETAMRLREMYTLSLDQIDLKRRTVFLERTKNGSSRQVPLSTVAVQTLQEYLKAAQPKTQLFPWWDGDWSGKDLEKRLREASNKLSKLFNNHRAPGIFQAAGCDDLHFHDLRHEATCRLYERTTLTDLQIAKITGHKELKMLARYANLRGSELADSLW